MRLSDRINRILLEKNMSSSDFINLTGISKTSFYEIKKGKTEKLSHHTAKKISSKFSDYSYEWLMGEDNFENYIGKNSKINVEEFLDIFFLYEEEIMNSPRMKKRDEIIKSKAVNEYQHKLLLDTLAKKNENQ